MSRLLLNLMLGVVLWAAASSGCAAPETREPRPPEAQGQGVPDGATWGLSERDLSGLDPDTRARVEMYR